MTTQDIMKLLLLSLLCAVSLSLSAQFNLLHFNNYGFAQCPSNPNITVSAPQGWSAYQTENDAWDGPMDASVCMDFTQSTNNANNAILNVSNAIEGKPIFLKKSFNHELVSNAMYGITNSSPFSFQQIATDCSDSFTCSGVLMLVEKPNHPDSAEATTTDTHFFSFESNASGFTTPSAINACLTTQHLSDQVLREFVMVLHPAWENIDDTMTLVNTWLLKSWSLEISSQSFYDMALYQLNDAVHNYSFFQEIHKLFLYDPLQGYPGPDNLSFIDIEPNGGVPSPTPQAILVDFPADPDWDQYVAAFQPFSFLRGALLEGSDSLRHPLEISFNDAQWCGDIVADYPLSPGDGVGFRNSTIDFGVDNCFILLENAFLKVEASGAFNYGLKGTGMLGMHPNSRVIIEEGATLQFGNTLALDDKLPDDLEQTFCDIYLHDGSTLTFAEHARVKNLSLNNRLKVRLHMLGGRVLFNGLTAEERSHFELVYPEVVEELTLEILGNPAAQEIRFRIWSPEAGQSRVSLFDLNGKLYHDAQVTHQQGWSEHRIPAPRKNGYAILRVVQANHAATKRVLVQN